MTLDNGTDGQTDGQTECDAIRGPLLKEEGRVITIRLQHWLCVLQRSGWTEWTVVA